ncbi:DUF4393 domain-containing protein [Alkalibaculum sp. M08DMB]|uniref:DUF4393 domain-containing protein n=1 Tax=Alkalibaculum sporogenes TaxID=2655001 RepID=A0A6A7K9D3_9FIRM|nr:DUF4393 domain-containing protein [Alkalibaculum sporogenes]MPW25965.1 DUF4393 domain-containing protein [Alkalibaculum sporogenes]
MESFSIIKCPQFLENAISPPAKEIGTTVANVFHLVFSPINYNVEKLRIKQAENLKMYGSEIEKELSKIPEEKLIEPPISIIGPALEASKFYIDEKEMREMFSKLIASSMNMDTSSKAHHSFVEIIKQLSPMDASNLKIISNSKGGLPIAEYKINVNTGGSNTIFTHVFLSNPIYDNKDEIAASISNLIRLGLISVTYSSYLINPELYSIFDNDLIYKNIVKEVNTLAGKLNYPYTSAEYQKGVTIITPLGKTFSTICF